MAKRRSKQHAGAKQDAEIILLKRFVKKLEPCLNQAAVEAFTDLLDQWLQAISQHNSELSADDILSIKDLVISLHQRLTGLQDSKSKFELLVKAGSHIRADMGATSYDFMEGRSSLRDVLNLTLEDGAPPTDLTALCEALSRIIQVMEKQFPPRLKRAPNRPAGIRDYPFLDALVHHLGIWSQTHLPRRFNAYVKTNGEIKIATGSLIRMLDSLRGFLASNHQMAWLANYLPTTSEHPTYMSTYQRALKAAFDEGREGSDPTEL
jgi:hypothetical protein